jgi:hypothetical protein
MEVMVGAGECQTGVICDSVLCAQGELCPNQKFCVNITATATLAARYVL